MSKREYLQSYLVNLVQGIVDHFNSAELDHICFELNVSPENLPGTTLITKCRELVQYLLRRGDLEKLVNICKRERPEFNNIWVSSRRVKRNICSGCGHIMKFPQEICPNCGAIIETEDIKIEVVGADSNEVAKVVLNIWRKLAPRDKN